MTFWYLERKCAANDGAMVMEYNTEVTAALNALDPNLPPKRYNGLRIRRVLYVHCRCPLIHSYQALSVRT